MQLICVDLLRVVIKNSNEVAHATLSHASLPKNILCYCNVCDVPKSKVLSIQLVP